MGGTTTLDFDEKTNELVRHFVSLNGTIVNCAGGIGLRQRSWITCEETTANAGTGGGPGWAKNHGYAFEVPVDGEAPAEALPITGMGRFAHEALAVDQRTGIVYQTEDAGSGVGSGFYRYLPNDRWSLLAGGQLQMLGIQGRSARRAGIWGPSWAAVAAIITPRVDQQDDAEVKRYSVLMDCRCLGR